MSSILKPLLLLAGAVGIYSAGQVQEPKHDVVITIDRDSLHNMRVVYENNSAVDTGIAARAVSDHFRYMLKNKNSQYFYVAAKKRKRIKK